MRTLPHLVWLLVAALAFSADARAQDYRRTIDEGNCLFWNVREYVYQVDEAGSARTPNEDEFAAIDASFLSWQSLSSGCSDFKFTQGGRIANPLVGYQSNAINQNVLLFREERCDDVVATSDPCWLADTCGNLHNCWQHSPGTIAQTLITHSTRTGRIVDADIEFNAGAYLFTTVSTPECPAEAPAVDCVATDLQNTLTHEIGHVLGFDHVVGVGSTMEETASPGEIHKRVIDVGTEEGFCITYPKGLPAGPCEELDGTSRNIAAVNSGTAGLGGLGCTAVSSSEGLFPFASLLLLFGSQALRRARRRAHGSYFRRAWCSR